MEAIEFVKSIRDRVIDSNYSLYQNLLETTSHSKELVWEEILPIYKSLSKEQKESFLNFLRLIQVNSVSHILGILDGSSYLNEKRESFILKTEQEDEPINGYLQDMFLELEEERKL